MKNIELILIRIIMLPLCIIVSWLIICFITELMVGITLAAASTYTGKILVYVTLCDYWENKKNRIKENIAIERANNPS